MEIKIDYNKIIGKIKPMHAVGQPPFIGMDFSMCDYLKDAAVPYSRLHDVGGSYGRNMFVDIPNIFRDFSLDTEDPENYDFAFTDELIKALVQRGIEPFFRLGVTIENYSSIKALRIYPPADNLKWARICEGIIRHYTEGWANGFKYKITYWEIWNEPDNYESPEENHMWRGTAEEYYKLYETASKYLKKKFPHLKIGGYASCGFYSLTHSDNKFAASSSRFEYFIEFFEGFLKYARDNSCPLDFFSWHSYAEIADNVVWAEYARQKLDEYGFENTEHTLNEWNCHPDMKGSVKHAVLTGAMMLALQKTSLDSAMFYDARCGMGIYSGMFDCMTYKPLPSYYSFVAFGELYKRKNQAYVSELPYGSFALAARGESDGCVVFANTTDKDINASLNLEIFSCKIIKEDAVYQDFTFEGILPAESIIILKTKI